MTPDKVDRVIGDRIVFESNFIREGHSGGGLFTAEWELVGMILADQPPYGRALSMASVLSALEGWNYSADLTPSESPPTKAEVPPIPSRFQAAVFRGGDPNPEATQKFPPGRIRWSQLQFYYAKLVDIEDKVVFTVRDFKHALFRSATFFFRRNEEDPLLVRTELTFSDPDAASYVWE